MKRLGILSLLLILGSAAAQAQNVPFGTSTSTVVNVASYLGTRIPRERGPWVLGEVLFFSANRLVSDFTWRQAVRGNRGSLYTNADIEGDIERLMALKKFDKVEAELYEIPGTPVPREFEGVAASTSQVRLVFMVTEKPAVETAAKAKPLPPAAVSGVVLTPTAWRGAGRYTTPGMGVDINAAYYIGRLYGKNSFSNAPRKTNYIDRLGVWLLTADGKMQIQSETKLRPALAVGAQATALLRDSPQPQIQTETAVTVKASDKNAKVLTDAYVVGSKKLGPARMSAGIMQGTIGDLPGSLSEFLTPEALRFYASRPGQSVSARTVPFASLLFLPAQRWPLGIEWMKFNGAPLNPWLINLKIGYFLKLNFDLAFLKYEGGYDVLGVLQFRYNYFPQR
jgi:hypothetical protein